MKRFICFVLAFAMVFSLAGAFAQSVFAEGAESSQSPAAHEKPLSKDMVYVNPLYRDVISEQDIKDHAALVRSSRDQSADGIQAAAGFTSVEAAGIYLRQQVKTRQESIVFTLKNADWDLWEDYIDQMTYILTEHTGVPTEGDYIAWVIEGWDLDSYGTLTTITFDFAMEYYTTTAQEAELDAAVESLLAQLDIHGHDYERICAVYNYITENITYDYEHVEDESYHLMFTAYAALCNRTAVCQGYAVLLYRLLLESGVDSRVITGYAGGDHAWNIARIGDVYYYLDSTWDAGTSPSGYRYFLKKAFSDHIPDDEYLTDDFLAEYPLAPSNFNKSTYAPAHVWSEPVWVWSDDYTKAQASWTCSVCGEVSEASAVIDRSDSELTATAYSPDGNAWTSSYKIAVLKSANLVLEGKITVNYKLTIGAEGCSARLYYEGRDMDLVRTVPLDASGPNWNGSVFTVSYSEVAAKEMTDSVRIKIFDGDGRPVLLRLNSKTDLLNYYDYSVSDWANSMISKYSGDASKALTVDLAKALLNYGGCAQAYFNNYHGYDPVDPKGYLSAEMAAVEADPAYNSQLGGDYRDAGLKSANLVLESDTTVNIKFTKPAAVTVGGEPAELTLSDGLWVLPISGIAAKELDTMFDIELSCDGYSGSLRYGALSWANSMLKSDKELTRNLAKSLYLYWRAAKAYFPAAN